MPRHETRARAAEPQHGFGDFPGRPSLPIGMSRTNSSLAEGFRRMISSAIGVPITPGHTAFMRMPFAE